MGGADFGQKAGFTLDKSPVHHDQTSVSSSPFTLVKARTSFAQRPYTLSSCGIIGAAQERLQERWTSSETVTKRDVKVLNTAHQT